jgi:hypothetical protein
MRSAIIQQDHHDLISLNRSFSPEERLVAFYHHSFLVSQFSAMRKVPVQDHNTATVHPGERQG